MIDVGTPDAGFVAVVQLRTSGPEQQHQLVDLLARDVEEWVRYCPGFISANYHVSADGTRVLNYAQWTDEEAYQASFRANPRSGALRAAIRAMPGVEGPEMVGYTLSRSVITAVREEIA